MKTTINLTDFYFEFKGPWHYLVKYTSPNTGKKWSKLITHMPLIDLTKNADDPQKCDLIELKRYIKN